MGTINDFLKEFRKKYPQFNVVGGEVKVTLPKSMSVLTDPKTLQDKLELHTSMDAWILEELSTAEIQMEGFVLQVAKKESSLLEQNPLPASAAKSRVQAHCLTDKDYADLQDKLLTARAKFLKLQGLHYSFKNTVESLGRILAYKAAELRLNS